MGRGFYYAWDLKLCKEKQVVIILGWRPVYFTLFAITEQTALLFISLLGTLGVCYKSAC